MYGRESAAGGRQALGARLWFEQHLRESFRLYLLVVVFFLAGIAVGAMVVQFLAPEQLAELASFLDLSLAGLAGAPLDQQALVQKALGQNLRFLLLIGFLGLTVIGFPLVLALIWLRGFMLGFTVGFLITEKAAAGILLSALALLPQNLFYVPAFLVAGGLAVGFSLRLVRGRQLAFAPSLWEQFCGYVVALAGAFVLVGLGGLVESYLTPAILRWLLTSIFR